MLSSVFCQDARSNTCRNLKFLNGLTNVDVVKTTYSEVKQLLPKSDIPPHDGWRKRLLDLFMTAQKNVEYRRNMNLSEHYVIAMIESLCSS